MAVLSKFFLFASIAFASDSSNAHCSFAGEWNKIGAVSYSANINYVEYLQLQKSPPSSNLSFQKYSQTLSESNVKDPVTTLKSAKDLWSTNYSSSKDLSGIITTIDSIIYGKIGKLRSATCLEWVLFEKGAELHGFDFTIPVYLETSWSVWKKDNSVKIILELGSTNAVSSNLNYLSGLFSDGWSQIYDIHNHPALHKDPNYTGNDFGPNLFPSPDDTRYWDGTLKWGNRSVAIIDGLNTLEVTAGEIGLFHQQYYCSKYPTSYLCK